MKDVKETKQPKIEKGFRLGELTVISDTGQRKNGYTVWMCGCSCGCLQARIVTENMKFVDGTSVTLLEKADKRLVSTNSSGYNGVYLNRKTQKWVAQIGFKGKTYYLGSYGKIEDAVQARRKAENQIYGEFLEWYYKTHPNKM